MNFFFVNETVSYYRKTSRGSILINLYAPTKEDQETKHINLKNIYFATPAVTEITSLELKKLKKELMRISDIDKNNIYKSKGFPIDITFGGEQGLEYNLKSIKNKTLKDTIDIVIINGFGAAIGDIVVGTSALNIYDQYVKQYFKNVNYHIYNEHQDACKYLLDKNSIVTNVMNYPSPLSALFKYDALIDLGAMTSFPTFNDRPMIDFYLNSFGIDTDTIPAYFKRTKLLYNIDPNSELNRFMTGFKISKSKLLLYNPAATTKIRNINEETSDKFLQFLIDKTNYEIITFHDSEIKHKRITNLSEFSKTTIDYMTIISNMDKIITVDTSTYHIADAYNIPTVVIFTTISPEYRIRYYPFCKPYKVLDDNHSLHGKHISQKEEDIKLLDDEVNKMDFDKILNLLED